MTVVDDTQVNIPRNKNKLKQMRKEEEEHGGGRESSGRYPETASGSIQAASGTNEGNFGAAGAGAQGVAGLQGTTGGHGEGIRQIDTAVEHSDSGAHRGGNTNGETKLVSELTPEEKAERDRERNRQNQQRHRDRKKEEEASSNAYAYAYDGVSGNVSGDIRENAKFQLKNPFNFAKEPEKKEEVKLFSNKEAEEEKERLTYVYTRGSGLLDDVLQIVVKGHEAVQIWQLDDSEAGMLAEIHLERAKKDKDAARSARILLELYDRLYTLTLISPRLIRTGQHIIGSGGLSFK